MNKDRFDYLMNTLSWDLSKEDLAEATEINDKVMPIMLGKLLFEHKDIINDNN